jgi:rubrerythrin
MKEPVWELNIRPLFRALDRRHMRFRLDLWKYDDVVRLAKRILQRIGRDADMPPVDHGGPWPVEWVTLFQRWMTATPPFARLELARGDYAAVRKSATPDTVTITANVVRPSLKSWIWFEEDVDVDKPFSYVLYLARDRSDTPQDVPSTVEEVIPIPRGVASITMRDSEGLKTVAISESLQEPVARKGRIAELMDAEVHDTDWIKKALQAAIELELATIPPYLCTLWSIDGGGTAAGLIRDIVRDEMGHMGLMCNLLRGLGESPKIVAPKYPGQLPGGVRPELNVYLSGLTRDSLHDVLMEIEKPEKPLAFVEETFTSIGKFYEAISDALVKESPTISTTGQMTEDRVGVEALPDITKAADAIRKIRGQGEGTTVSAKFNGTLAHYYKFGEIYHGHKLVDGPPPTFTGAEVPFPKTFPMAKVPYGGWPNRDPDGKGTLKAFNDLYSSVLKNLELAWGAGGATSLGAAVDAMGDMKDLAKTLMQIPRGTCDGNYGPDFIV